MEDEDELESQALYGRLAAAYAPRRVKCPTCQKNVALKTGDRLRLHDRLGWPGKRCPERGRYPADV